MKNKTKKPKLITGPVTSLGISFSPGDHLLAVRGYDATKLSAKLEKVFRKIEKRGKGRPPAQRAGPLPPLERPIPA
jgi:hypothetical protein